MRPFNTHPLLRSTCCCLIGLFLFLGLSCDKKEDDTMVHCTILDAETLLPISGAVVIYDKMIDHNYLGPVYTSGRVESNSDGYFEINLGPMGGKFQSIFKDPNYFTLSPINMPVDIRSNVVNDLVILMRPQNSKLKVIVRNKYGLKDKIYVGVSDNIYESEYGKGQGRTLKKYPLTQNIGTEFVDSFYVFSNIYTKIRWRLATGASVPYIVDSLMITKNETATYLIEY